MEARLRAALQRREAKGTLRRLTRFEDDQAPALCESTSVQESSRDVKGKGKEVAGRRWIDFSSNDYLSFATSPELKDAYMGELESYRQRHHHAPLMSSSGSRLLDGNNSLAEALEEEIASHFGSPNALIFNTGFSANAALLSVLPQPGDLILYDELIHASMHDGIRKSRANARAFLHNSPRHLEELLVGEALRCREGATVFVAVESVYSMDGDLCPLVEVVRAAKRHVPEVHLCIMVDEAHGAGVYGTQGRGCTAALGLEQNVNIRLVTFGKALGSAGAAVLCSDLVKQFLLNYARPLIYSTALPPTSLISMRVSLAALRSELHVHAQARCFSNATLFRQLLSVSHLRHVRAVEPGTQCEGKLGIRMPSPIVPVLTPRPKQLAAYLQLEGALVVRGITYPTVPKGQDRVRICLHANNTEEEIRSLSALIKRWDADQGSEHAGTEQRQPDSFSASQSVGAKL